ELILLFARDIVLPSENLSRLAHQHLCQRAEKSVAIHAIDKFLMAETISPPSALKIIGKPRHRFGSARQHAIEVTGSDLLKCERDGLDAGRARLVHRVGGDLPRNAAADGNLPRGIGTASCLPTVAEDG